MLESSVGTVCTQSKCRLKLKGRKGKGRERLVHTHAVCAADLVSDIVVGIVGMQVQAQEAMHGCAVLFDVSSANLSGVDRH